LLRAFIASAEKRCLIFWFITKHLQLFCILKNMAVFMNKINLMIILIMLIAPTGALYPLNEGQKSPAIIMRASNGDSFIPSKGGKDKPLIISFFSDDCPPCLKEIPELQKIQLSSDKVAVYLVADVNTDKKKSAAFFDIAEKKSGMKITIPVVFDVYSDMKNAFGVKAYPALFLIDKNGSVVLRFDGYKTENIEKLNEYL